jgi:hypothetical protein
MEYETLDNNTNQKKSHQYSNYQQKVFKTVIENENHDRDDFSSMLIDLTKKVNIKIAIFLFLLGIFIFSDLFIEMILSKFNGAVDGTETTTKGTILQLLFMSISYIVIDLLVQGEIL